MLVQVSGIAQEAKIPIYTSPIINADRTVVFNIYAPKANNVSLLSSIQTEHITMIKGENGLWTITIGPVTPEIYHYQFDIDGVQNIRSEESVSISLVGE